METTTFFSLTITYLLPRSRNNLQNENCQGSLIHPEYVLTAAHCFYPARDGAPWGTAYIGAHKTCFYGRCDAEQRGIADLWVHPDYDDSTSQHDVAILKLDSPVYSIEPVEIRSVPFEFKDDFGGDLDAIVLGWGVDDVAEDTMGQVLQKGEVMMVSRYACYRNYGYRFRHMLEGMVCAHSPNQADACQGDSGGPLFNPSTGVQVGVVSWGEGCGQPDYPCVYADVGLYHTWISGIVDWNYTTVTTIPTTLPALWNGQACADKTSTGWADNNGNPLSCSTLKEWGYCSPEANDGAVINDCPVACEVCTPGDIVPSDITSAPYVWQGGVCADKQQTGWIDSDGGDLSCTVLDNWGYCNPDVQSGAVIADCPVTCGACIPEATSEDDAANKDAAAAEEAATANATVSTTPPAATTPPAPVDATEAPPAPLVCAQEVQPCADGSFVGRNSKNECKFDECPPSAGEENGPGGGNSATEEEAEEEGEFRDPTQNEEDPVRPSMHNDPSRPGTENELPFCALQGIEVCQDEDVLVDGVSKKCFDFATSAKITADAAPCTQCTPSITSPGTVCAECKSALANAVRACNLPAASPAPAPPPPPAPTPAPPPPCRCKHKWSYGAKTFTGCAKTPDEDEPWCYLEEACSGSAPSSQFIGWHWADCNAEEYLATVAESNVCAGLARNKCKKVGEDVCRWLPGKAKGCFEAGGDLPCKAFPTSWKCKNGNGGNSCQWWKNKCVDTLLCDKGTSECCGKGQKQCWKVKDACTFVRLSTCMPRLQ